jgi:hypothetical protein
MTHAATKDARGRSSPEAAAAERPRRNSAAYLRRNGNGDNNRATTHVRRLP